LEKEADVMGARALQMKPFSLSDYKTGNSLQKEGIVQKVGWWGKKKPSGDKEEKERISAMKLSKIKFNFAGSGESTWKTRKDKYREGRPSSRLGRLAENIAHFTGYRKIKENEKMKGFEKAEHLYGGKKLVKQKENKEQIGTRSMVVEYAGPIKRWDSIVFLKKGANDTGKNSTAKNLEDAKKVITDFLSKQPADLKKERKGEVDYHEKMQTNVKIDIDIKGFSRGAATASTFAAWLKSNYGENFNVNLLLIDPVDGHKQHAEMAKEVDVSQVYDETKKDKEGNDTTGTTIMMPIKSGHEWITSAFTPQKIRGFQRLILILGKGAKHSFGLRESDKSKLQYEGKKIKQMELTKLPKGLYVVNSLKQPLTVTKLNLAQWNMWKHRIMLQPSKREERHEIIKNALEVEILKYMK
jgi:hypothetical protein